MRRAARPQDRSGAAVFAAVLLLLALTALGHGMLVLARQELGAARAGARVLAERAAAQAGALLVEGAPLPPEAAGTALWGTVPVASGDLGPVRYDAHALRLSRELWLARGRGWHASEDGADRPGIGARAARALWVLEPVARTAAFGGVLSVAQEATALLAGEVDGLAVNGAPPPLTASMCEPWRAALDSVFPSGSLPAIGRHAAAPERPRLGLLTADSLLARIRIQVSGTGSPAPATDGAECLADEPWSWGDPESPLGPCGGSIAVRAVPGDLDVDGGAGQALLFVGGDLVLRGGATLHGIALVGGVLRVIDGARLVGLASAEGGVEVEAGARVEGSTCWAVRALEAAARDLAGPVPLPGSGWIGPL